MSGDPVVSAFEGWGGPVDLRAAERFRILQRCVTRLAGAAEGWPSVAFDVSATGVGLTLPVSVPPGSLLSVEPWGQSAARPLEARVVQARQVESLWFVGCQWATRLSEGELLLWRSGPLDWVRDAT